MIPQGIKCRAMHQPRSHASSHGWWWTPQRDAKLRYVMEKYDDYEKASRVLGIPQGQRGWVIKRWNAMKFGRVA